MRSYVDDARDYFNDRHRKDDASGCWIWTGAFFSNGYGVFKQARFHAGALPASRGAWLLFRGEIPEKLMVCHTCDNRACVNPDHLFLGTHKQNMDDCGDKQRYCHGESRPQAKLTDSDVRKILILSTTYGWGYFRLARVFGVSNTAARGIVKRFGWKHISVDDATPQEMAEAAEIDGLNQVARAKSLVQPHYGEQNASAKIGPNEVELIRQRRAEDNATLAEIAREFGLSVPTVFSIVTLRTWLHVKTPWDDFLRQSRSEIASRAHVGKGGNHINHHKGAANSASKLTADQVREIRKLNTEGKSYSILAAQFGVSKSQVANIITRRLWSDLD